jgi:hypothetical protein
LRVVQQRLEQLLDGRLDLRDRQPHCRDCSVRKAQVAGWLDNELRVVFLVRIQPTQDPNPQNVPGGDGGFELTQDLDIVPQWVRWLQRESIDAFNDVEPLNDRNGGWRCFESAGPARVEKTVGLATGTNGRAGDDCCKFTVLVIHCIRLLAEFNRWRTAYGFHRPDGTQT